MFIVRTFAHSTLEIAIAVFLAFLKQDFLDFVKSVCPSLDDNHWTITTNHLLIQSQ